MNVFQLLQNPPPPPVEPVAYSDPFWVGRLSAIIAICLPRMEREPKVARREMQSVFDDFMLAHPDGELKDMLRGYLR